MMRFLSDRPSFSPADLVQERYEQLFHNSPVALFEHDWSELRQRLGELISSGIDNLAEWLDTHPDELIEFGQRMQIVDVNKAGLQLYGAKSIEEFRKRVGEVFGDGSLQALRSHLVARLSGRDQFQTENIHYTLKGERIYVRVIIRAAVGHEESWDRMLISVVDITSQRQAELQRDGQRRVLEQLAAEEPLSDVLDGLVAEIEKQSPDLHASIYRIDQTTFQTQLLSSGNTAEEVSTLLNSALVIDLFPNSAKEELRLDFTYEPPGDRTPLPGLIEALRRVAACCDYGCGLVAPIVTIKGQTVGVLAIFLRNNEDFTAHEESVVSDFRGLTRLVFSHHRRRQALVTRTSELQSVFETYPDALLRVAADGTILELYSGRSMGADLGVVGSWTRNTISSLVSTEDGQRFQEAMAKVAAGSPVESVEFHLYDIVDGTQAFEARFVPLATDGEQIVIFRDVTRMKEAERALDQASERFRYLFDNSPDAIFVESPNGVVLDANRAACDLHQMQRNQLVGTKVFDLIPPDDRQAAAGRAMPLMTGEITEFESNSLRGDGSVIPVSVRISTITYNDEPALLLHVRDITERREEETRRRQQELQLAHVSRLTMMGQIVAGIAHEIRQPLWSISTFVDVCHEALARDDAIDRLPRIRELIERLVKETRRVNTITSRMFSFARKGMPGRTPVRVSDLVGEAVGILESRARSNLIEITTELPEDPVVVLCDRVLIEQTLVNMLNNACSALSSDTQPGQKTIRIEVAQQLELVRFRIIDNGPGLPEGLAPEQLFEGFFTTSERGMGIGLALCHSFVEDHGGTISAETNESGGMTFEFTLRIDGESNGSH